MNKRTSQTQNRSFSEDEAYRRKLLFDAGLDPRESVRIRSIAGPAEIRAIVRAFQSRVSFYQPGFRPRGREREADSHSLANVASFRFRANLHVHTQYSDGLLSVPELLRQAAEYADLTAFRLSERSPVRFAPFTIGIMDHNRVNGCVEAIHRVYEEPERFRNLRVILGSEVTIRLHRVYQFQFKEKRHVHFLLSGITPQDPQLEAFFQPFLCVPPPSCRDFRCAKSASISQMVQMLREQKFGTISMAHPSRIQLKRFLLEPEHSREAMRQYIHLFKRSFRERALYVEAYYQAYSGNLAVDREEFQTILESAAAERLLLAGGMDTHGANIFFSKASPPFQI